MSRLIYKYRYKDVSKRLSDAHVTAYSQLKPVLSKTVFWTHTNFVLNATTKIHVRTGNLRRSFSFNISGNTLESLKGEAYQDTLKGKVSLGSEVVYAPVHEFGKTIKAKNKYKRVEGGAYLNIPLPPNKTASGVTRRTARQVFNDGGYIAKSAKGKWLVFNSRNLPMFVLKKQVKIPKRLGLRKIMKQSYDELDKNIKAIKELI